MSDTTILATITFDLTSTADQPIAIPAKCVVTGAAISDVVGTPAGGAAIFVKNGGYNIVTVKPATPGYVATATTQNGPSPIVTSGTLNAKITTAAGTSCQLHIIGFEVP